MAVRRLLPAIILLYMLLACAYSAVTPAATPDQHNPDENAHMEYVKRVASGHLPVFTDAQHGYENHQPPLYYALCAPVYLAAHGLGDPAATRAVRCVSIGLGALLIWVTFRCVATLFPGENTLALGTAAFVGLLPENVALSASVTNDSLTTLICAVCLWQLVYLIQKSGMAASWGDWWKQAAWLGVTLGLGVWTKSLSLPLFPSTLAAFLLLARAKLVSGRRAAFGASLAVGTAVLLGAPWLVRNTVLYGDPLAQRVLFVQLNNGGSNVPIDQMIYLFGGVGGYLAKVAQWAFESFWGGFDSMRLFWDQNPYKSHPDFLHGLSPTYECLLGLTAVSCAGLLRQMRRDGAGARQVALLVLAAQIVFAGIAFLNYNLHYFQAQGRYLYPALLPIAFFFVWGWQGLLPRWLGAFTALMAISLVGLNLYTLFGLLLPRFAV